MQPPTQDPVNDQLRADGEPVGRIETAFRQLDGDPRFAWTHRRRCRLLLVMAQAGFLLVSLVLVAFERPLLALVAFLPFFPLMSFINIAIHGLLDRPVDQLDDVMQRLRADAKATAHTAVVWLLGAVLASVLLLAVTTGDGVSEQVDAPLLAAFSAVAGLLLLSGLLPRWILASRLPEPDTDDA